MAKSGKGPGRPGKGRVKHGLIRASILPNLKEEAEDIARHDSRLRSLSQIVEAAMGFWLLHYKKAHGVLDPYNHPVIQDPPEGERLERPPMQPRTRPY